MERESTKICFGIVKEHQTILNEVPILNSVMTVVEIHINENKEIRKILYSSQPNSLTRYQKFCEDIHWWCSNVLNFT